MGGAGGSPSCGAMRRPGSVGIAGVGLGCEVCVGDGDALGAGPVVRGRESGCWALLALDAKNESAAIMLTKSPIVVRRVRRKWKVRSLITAKLSFNKRLMSNDFRGRESRRTGDEFEDAESQRILMMQGS